MDTILIDTTDLPKVTLMYHNTKLMTFFCEYTLDAPQYSMSKNHLNSIQNITFLAISEGLFVMSHFAFPNVAC